MSSPEIRLHAPSEELSRSITELFHRINSVVPDSQKLLSVQGETLAFDALELLRKKGYSQLPVLVGNEVIGIFSYRSFSRAVLENPSTDGNPKTLLADLTVEECYEKAEFARWTDDYNAKFDALDRDNCVLVGEAHQVEGILTPIDVLRYLHDKANLFVLVAEIETSLRALMRLAVSPEKLAECLSTTLTRYKPDRRPSTLEELMFGEYVQIIDNAEYWPLFEPIFRVCRARTIPKLRK